MNSTSDSLEPSSWKPREVDPSSTTLQLGLQLFQSELGTAWGPLLAMNTLALVPVAVLFLIAQRAITETFARSGIQ
jgi:ABC-type glycerol-3-phosphate transport system permease component